MSAYTSLQTRLQTSRLVILMLLTTLTMSWQLCGQLKDQTCGVALFCTTHRVTDEFDVPNTQDVVVSVCAENQLGVQTSHILPYVRYLGLNVHVKVVVTTNITVVHALLSDDLRHAALAGKQTTINTIRIVPNLSCEAKLGLAQRLGKACKKLFC